MFVGLQGSGKTTTCTKVNNILFLNYFIRPFFLKFSMLIII